MNTILEDLKKFALEVFKGLPYQELAYRAMVDTIIPLMEEKANDTNSLVDNVMVDGVKQAVRVFLTPPAKNLPPPPKLSPLGEKAAAMDGKDNEPNP